MRKERNEYNSPVDALVTIAKRLSLHETRHGMSSEDFFNKYEKGLIPSLTTSTFEIQSAHR